MRNLLILAVLSGIFTQGVSAAERWRDGTHYFSIQPAQSKLDPANKKVEVVEVFSYGCPACMQFYPIANKLKAKLPPTAHMDYLPASFIPSESWPLFQRIYYTAQALGVAVKTHDAMFDAVWKTHELGIVVPNSDRLKTPPPSIEDAARFYKRIAGVPEEKFLATARSFDVDRKMRWADEMMKLYQADSTPTIVINGKYRLTAQSAGGYDQLIELVQWLVAKEGKQPATAAKKAS